MNDYFIFKGLNSSWLDIIVSEFPAIQKPQKRTEYIEVPGRDGFMTFDDESHAPLEKSITIVLKDASAVNEVKDWLHGEGDLILSSEPDVFYKARIDTQIDFQRLGMHKRATITFKAQPHGYIPEGLDPIIIATPTTIYNLGTAPSRPVIKVTGTGNITLTIGTKNVILTAVSGYVTINSEIMDSYKDLTPKNNYMQGEWPILEVGANAISWTGTVTSVEIIPNWRNK